MFSQRTFSHNSQNFSCFIDSLLRFSLDYETTFQLEYFTKQQKETFFFVPSVRNWGKLFIFKKSRLAREDEKIDESEKNEKLLHSISCRCWRWWLLSLVVLSRRGCEMRERHAIFIFYFHFVCSSVQSFEKSLEKRDEQRNEKLRKSSIFLLQHHWSSQMLFIPSENEFFSLLISLCRLSFHPSSQPSWKQWQKSHT